jgi:hypothetical protein
MAIPNVITYSVGTGNATYIVNVAAATNAPLALNNSLLPGYPLQQRVLVTSSGNDSSIYFRIVGLNQANNTIVDYVAGSNATYAQSNLDFAKIISVQGVSSTNIGTPTYVPSPAATAATVSVGVSTTGGVACSLWQIMNWNVSPTNIELSGLVVTVATAGATWTAQYCYDDPNNLPPGVYYPQPYSHPTLLNQTGTLDGPINDPVTGIRLMINAGTGTVRFTIIQAGVGSP